MRRLLTFLSVLLLAPQLFAKTADDWRAIEKVHWDTPLRIELWNGEELIARFQDATPDTLQIKVRDPQQHGLTVRRDLSRDDIHIVEQLGRRHQDPYKLLRGGQVIGGVGGAVAFGILAGRAWPIGVIAGGATGMMLGTMVGGSAALIAETGNHHRKIVYQAAQKPATASPSIPAPVF